MLHAVTILTVQPNKHPAALPRIEQSLRANASKGELLGCFATDIGALNQVMLIHAYRDESDLTADRSAILRSSNPFGIADLLTKMEMDTYVPFDFLPPIKPGKYGPVYEVRTYVVKPDGLAGTIEAWRTTVPGRLALSPILTAMYSVTGRTARFMHIWPYATLEERRLLRTKAVETKVWPPAKGPEMLLQMQTDIYLPAAFSPLQ